MKRVFFSIIFALVFTALGWGLNIFLKSESKVASPIQEIIPKPLEKYTIENLTATNIKPGKLTVAEEVFTFEFQPDPKKEESKKTTGEIRIPEGEGPFPVVVMFRGYVDQTIFQTGVGTNRAAEFFSANGFITIAPDFLGYGGSDAEAGNIFESRFQTYVTALSLIKSLNQVEKWNQENIFLWGHSNGGQIALTTLEVTHANYPTTLWAPVSKPFPYSVLYYTDESEDRGKLIRRELARFEELYDPDLYAIDKYFDRIQAPLQLHQGTNDDAVPVEWSDELNKNLENLEKDIVYFIYPATDHNLRPSWDTVVARDLAFFQKHLTAD